MGDTGLYTPLPSASKGGERPGADGQALRERFLPFAFAGADLLLEVSANGRIDLAIGAFRPRFGREAESYLGTHVSALVAAEDQPAFAIALATAATRGRIPPTLLRLADRAGSLASVAGLMVPSTPPRLCITIGSAPTALPSVGAGTTALQGVATFARAAATALQAAPEPGRPGPELGLVEITGWSAVRHGMGAADHRALREEVTALLLAAAPAAMASEVAEGRFSLLSETPVDIDAVSRQVQHAVRSHAQGQIARVQGATLHLAAGAVASAQAVGALRLVLSQFAAGGLAAARDIGAGDGLSGVVGTATKRARAVEQAITERRFRLQFQPIVDLATLSVHHFEALMRPTPNPDLPTRSTLDFVTFVEAVGLSEALDWAVLQETLRVLEQRAGPVVAINVSGLSMQSPDFCERALDVLVRANLAHRLMFELTETAEIENMAAAATTMNRLRALGSELCLDDFGAGAAAFRYLRELPVDYVKIDGAFVRAAPTSPRERSFMASMVELAHSVGARAVAEMIETEAELANARELGVEFGQGWLFGRPGAMPGAL